MFAEIASRRPIVPTIEVRPLSYLDPRIFAPQVDVSGVVEGNLAATKSVMAGINSAVSSVAGGITGAVGAEKAGAQQSFENDLATKRLAQGDRQLDISANRPLAGVGSRSTVDPIGKAYNSYLNEGYKSQGTDWTPPLDFNQFKELYSGTGEKKQSPSSWYQRGSQQSRSPVRFPLE